jgi:hypothetical protein
MVPIGCPEMTLSSYLSMPHNLPAESRSSLHQDGCLKSHTLVFLLKCKIITVGSFFFFFFSLSLSLSLSFAMQNLMGSMVYSVIKGLPLLMPWSSYIDSYVMVLEEGKGIRGSVEQF